SKPLGFAKEAIVNIELPENDFTKSRALKTRLQEIKGVESVSLSLGAPTSDANFSTGFNLPEAYKTEKFDTRIKLIDYHYLNTYQMKLVAGRWFNENEEKLTEPSVPSAERKYSYLVNEALVKRLGFANPNDILGRHIVTGLNDIDAEVVGVVQDFHTNSLHMAVEPTVLVHFPHFYYDAGMRVNTANLSEKLDEVKKAYAAVYPDNIFHYTFLDEHIESLYRQEERIFTLIQIFAGLSIFISCLGLYGLVSFLTQAKVKEVGICKVFGASVANIAILFSRSFVTLIVAAFAIAAPLAWYFMSQWLNGFAYHVNVGLTNLVIGFISTVFVALATMGYRCVSAARANPVNSLRSE
ncbi:MAG: ABC transporter permease, partial [Flammeovirgaceae bacterium]